MMFWQGGKMGLLAAFMVGLILFFAVEILEEETRPEAEAPLTAEELIEAQNVTICADDPDDEAFVEIRMRDTGAGATYYRMPRRYFGCPRNERSRQISVGFEASTMHPLQEARDEWNLENPIGSFPNREHMFLFTTQINAMGKTPYYTQKLSNLTYYGEAEAGLSHYGYEEEDHNGNIARRGLLRMSASDFYTYFNEDDEPEFLIECDGEELEGVLARRCWFEYNYAENIEISITMSIEQLANWESIRARLNAFLEEIIVPCEETHICLEQDLVILRIL